MKTPLAVHRRSFLAAAGAAALPVGAASAQATPESVLRIAMTLSDIPVMNSQPDQGAEGWRFIGNTLFDGLVAWDLSHADRPSTLMPGLATQWSTDPSDRNTWTFKLRQNVKFHDGSPFNADAVVWNFDKLVDHNSPQYDPRQVAQVFGRTAGLKSYRKIDDVTFELVTKAPDALWPYYLSRIFFASPTQWQKLGRDWAAFARAPSGTGPWKLDRLLAGQRAELVRNAEYWNPQRVPRADRLVLLPIPDDATRTAALLSGQVDWIESPSPDALQRLKQAGMNVVSNVYQQICLYLPNLTPDSKWSDVRIRKAANLAIDRASVVKLVNGLAVEAKGHVLPNSPWFGKPSFDLVYDPTAAKKLMADAGFGPGNPFRTKFLVPTSGSGMVDPLGMNELIQENLRAIGIEAELQTMEWNAFLVRARAGAQSPECAGLGALSDAWATFDPDFGFIGLLDSAKIPPHGINWSNVRDPVFDQQAAEIRAAFDPKEQDAAVARMHERMVDNAVMIWVVHDLSTRALSPGVHGFVQAQHWIQDFSPVSVS